MRARRTPTASITSGAAVSSVKRPRRVRSSTEQTAEAAMRAKMFTRGTPHLSSEDSGSSNVVHLGEFRFSKTNTNGAGVQPRRLIAPCVFRG